MKQDGMLEFLAQLAANNSLEWMHAHKKEQQAAAAGFEALVQALAGELALHDAGVAGLKAKDLIFRMNRDTRFSSDKSPYKAAFRAHIGPAGRMPIPVGYYLHLEPGNVFLGGGLYASMFPGATARIREELAENGAEFLQIVQEPFFEKNFELVGEKLKKVPQGFDPALPQSEYLKYKSWALEYHLADEAVADRDAFLRQAADAFLRMRPFNDYLNRAREGYKLPERPGKG